MPDSRPGRASRDPQLLCPCVRSRLADHLKAAETRSIPVTVIETWRDEERQHYYRAIGVSHTLKSFHLPHPPNGLSLAYDVAPTEYLAMKGWHPGGEQWRELAEVGQALGLDWGGEWASFPDQPHYQATEGCLCGS